MMTWPRSHSPLSGAPDVCLQKWACLTLPFLPCLGLKFVGPSLFLFFNLEYHCFTMLSRFLLYNEVNHLSVQFSCSVVSDSLWPHELQQARPPCPSPNPGVHPNPCPLMPSNQPILCRPLLPWSSIFPGIRVFSNESALRIRWPNYWSFSFSISPSKEHPGLISFRMDWLDLLAGQGSLQSLLQHHISKASILRCSALFIV